MSNAFHTIPARASRRARATRASLRAHEWAHANGATPVPALWQPHLAERAYAAELVHAERVRAARCHPVPLPAAVPGARARAGVRA